MAYYKFHPKNHICSLTWTVFCLYVGISEGDSILDAIGIPIFMGVPTVFVGIGIREKSRQTKLQKVVELINEQQTTTVGQAANVLNISGDEARELLSILYKEERIDMSNRDGDMTVIFTPIK